VFVYQVDGIEKERERENESGSGCFVVHVYIKKRGNLNQKEANDKNNVKNQNRTDKNKKNNSGTTFVVCLCID
jgi:hypothetical protein